MNQAIPRGRGPCGVELNKRLGGHDGGGTRVTPCGFVQDFRCLAPPVVIHIDVRHIGKWEDILRCLIRNLSEAGEGGFGISGFKAYDGQVHQGADIAGILFQHRGEKGFRLGKITVFNSPDAGIKRIATAPCAQCQGGQNNNGYGE